MIGPNRSARSVMMLGTFGVRPKATLRARALAMAQALRGSWSFRLMTTPWDHPSDAGERWIENDVPVMNTRVTRPILFPLAAAEMIRESHRVPPSLVHLFKPKGFGDIAARWLARSVPVVVDMDDWEGNGGWNEIGGYSRLQRRAFDWQERTWPRTASAITVASRQLEARAVELGADADRVFYVPNGLTRTRFNALSNAEDPERARVRWGLSDKRVVILYTRFVEFAPEFVVPLFSRVRGEIPDAVLLVVGASATGDAERAIRRESQRAAMSDSIVFAGWAPDDEIASLLAAGEVAVHPFDDNLVNRSKCSVKVLELMAAGRSIVSNAVGENARMIEHGESGLLVTPGDSAAMARAVVRILNDPVGAATMGRNARDRVHTRYLWEQLAPRVAEAYQLALQHPRLATQPRRTD